MSPGLRASAAAGGMRAGAFLAVVGAGLLVGCQSPAPSPGGSVAASIAASDPATPSAAASPSADIVTVDPTLLSILPREVGGTLMLPAPENATDIAKDPSLVSEVEAIAVALAVASDTDDMVIANVVRLRPDVFDDSFFEGWRTSYDAAACEPAGGILGRTEDEIDDRKVFVGTCENGGSTYHVRYGEDVIVSLTSTGERRFGELLMAHLGE